MDYLNSLLSTRKRTRVLSKNLYTNSFTRKELRNTGFYCIKNLSRSNAIELPLFHFTTILWKILYLILFGHIKTNFVRYLIFGSASRVDWDKLTVSEMVQDIESVGQPDWFLCHIF